MVTINKKRFEDLQLTGVKMCVIFYSDVEICEMAINRLNLIMKDYPKIEFYRISIDNEKALFSELGITTVPTVILYHGKDIYEMLIGLDSVDNYKQKLNELTNV